MSTEFKVKTAWLHHAWFGVKKRELPIHLIVEENELRVTAMTHQGAGLRTCMTPIENTNSVIFEVSDALRCFIKNCMGSFEEAEFLISSTGLTISLQSAVSGIQYMFPKLKMTEENVIPSHNDDQRCHVSARDWYNLWTTIPPKGECTLTISKQSKLMTFKHDGGRWAGALQMKTKPRKDAKVVIRPAVARVVFSDVKFCPVWGEVIFMKVGVLQWNTRYTRIYIAPVEN